MSRPEEVKRVWIYRTPVPQIRKGFTVRTMSGDRLVTESITRELDHDEVTRLTFADGGTAHYYSDAILEVIANC